MQKQTRFRPKRQNKSGLCLETLEQRLPLTAQLVADLNDVELGLDPTLLTSVNEDLYFTANAGETLHPELWKSDGTTGETEKVLSIESSHTISNLGAIGDRLVFTTETLTVEGHQFHHLYVSDGTPDGTTQVANDLATDNPYFLGTPGFHVTDSTVFTVVPTQRSEQLSVYATDGTESGTKSLAGISPCVWVPVGQNGVQSHCEPITFEGNGNELFYSGKTLNEDRSLVSIDLKVYNYESGTSRVIKRLANEVELVQGQLPQDLTAVDELVYFTFADADHGRELWVTDGTEEGTQMVADLNEGPSFQTRQT